MVDDVFPFVEIVLEIVQLALGTTLAAVHLEHLERSSTSVRCLSIRENAQISVARRSCVEEQL